MFKKAEQDVREGVGGKRQGGQGVKTKEGKLRAAATAHQKRAEELLGQMQGPWEEAKKSRLLKAPLPKMPPSTLPPFGIWEVTGGHLEELLHGVVFVGHPGGWEVYDLAATAVSQSCTKKLREGGISVRMHTAPKDCNRRSCLYAAVRVLLWHMSHPVSPNPPALKNLSMWGRQEMKDVSKKLPPVGGRGKGPVPFARLTGNMVPLVVLYCIANPDSGLGIPKGGKGKAKGGG